MIRRSCTMIVAIMPLASAAAWAAEVVPPDHAAKMTQGTALFSGTVREIFLSECLKCHGGEKTKAGFDLSSRESLLKGGDDGLAIVPGDASKSRMMKLLRHEEDPHMPSKGPPLPAATIAAIGKWIDLGAPYDKPLAGKTVAVKKPMVVTDKDRQFWSFKPLQKPTPPKVAGNWARTPIDAFIQAKLEEKTLRPNPIADRRTLIRRAYFDLIGLPPTPEEIEAFIADPAADAYEKLIDRLLRMPQYGERWAPHWLDVARYAESDGYEQDYDRPNAFYYRDFVIRALNDDLPYSDFVRWQIAGDEVAPQNPMAMMATGFLTAGVFPTQITEKEFESTRYDQMDDMSSTTALAFLGLTVGCARCHDHKYDPFPVVDYYRLLSTFTTAIRSDIDLDIGTPEQREKAKREYEAKRAPLVAAIKTFETEQLTGKLAKYVSELKQRGGIPQATWAVLDVSDIKTANGTRFVKQPDGSLLRTGTTPDKDVYTFAARADGPISAIRLEALTHDSFPQHGPGLAGNGNFALGDFRVAAAPADGSAAPVDVKLINPRATHQQNTDSLSIAASIDGDPVTGWAVDLGGIGKDQAAIFDLEKPLDFKSGALLTFTLRFEHPNRQHAIGRPRLSVTNIAAPSFKADAGPDAHVTEILNKLAADQAVEPAQAEAVRAWFARGLPEFQKLKADLAALDAAGPAKATVAKVQVTTEGMPPVKNHADDRGYPHFYKETFLLKRGDVNSKVEPAAQGFLQVLERDGKNEAAWQVAPPAGSRTSFRRASLANWIIDADHGAGHLAARVMVNRVWQHHLGRGIVSTPSDFGFQGDRPTNPELLDWLADEFIRGGWKVKQLHKLIMTSAVYMQGSTPDETRAGIDPQNIYLWRFSPRRLEGEPIRDAMLAVSGTLDPRLFGAGTLDENNTRRSVYFQIKRSQMIPSMMLFDWPERLGSIGVRSQTTISPQALLFMNSPQVRRYAEGFAARVAPEFGKSPAAGIERVYQLALGRAPTADESARSIQFIEQQKARYNGDARNATVDFCQAIFSLNEFVYIN
jgi:hypothetical protein